MRLKAATLITQAESHKFSKDFNHRNKMTAMQNVLNNKLFLQNSSLEGPDKASPISSRKPEKMSQF